MRSHNTYAVEWSEAIGLSSPNFDSVVLGSGHEPVVEDAQRPHPRAVQGPAANPVRPPYPDGVVAACRNLTTPEHEGRCQAGKY